MAARKISPTPPSLDPTQDAESDAYAPQEEYSDSPAAAADYSDADADGDASVCPNCGEPLAWHEEACSAAAPAAAPQPTAPPVAEVVAAPEARGLTPTPFVYAVGQPVQPAPDAPSYPVIWRGQVKVRHPRTGWWHRVNVYRLNDGYWDCYYEGELQAA